MTPKFEPSWSAPDWMIIIRATWMTGQIRSDAAKEAYHRGLELSARPERHRELLEAALVADQDEARAA